MRLDTLIHVESSGLLSNSISGKLTREVELLCLLGRSSLPMQRESAVLVATEGQMTEIAPLILVDPQGCRVLGSQEL